MKKYTFFLLLITACNSGETITKTEVEEPAARIVEYTPAPGQFINSTEAAFGSETITDAAAACAYAERRFATNDYVSLGGWGGYIVVQFDTPVVNTGDYDLYVKGNSFGGSSEPGIVWVAQDADADGLPDVWYQLRGSEYDNTQTIHNYEVTYTQQPSGEITWTDNQNPAGHGTIDRVAAHTQTSYIPAWVGTLTYRGTCMRDNVRFDQTLNKYIMEAFSWGYADNWSTIDGKSTKNRFKIANAVDQNGESANLLQIDFVKVQTGVNCKAGNGVGEISTEVCRIGCYRTIVKTE